MASLLILQMFILVASAVANEWQPCEPYKAQQVNDANFTSWFGLCEPGSLSLQVLEIPWGANFSILGKHFGLHPHPSNDNVVLVSFDGETENWPANAFPVNKWTTLNFTIKDEVIDVEVSTLHQISKISSRLQDTFVEAEIKPVQLTSARLSWECPGECVGQEINHNTTEKQLNGTTHTFFLLPKTECQIIIELAFNDCANNSQNITLPPPSYQDLGLLLNVWNKVTMQYEELEDSHGYSLKVNNFKITNGYFYREWPYPNCHGFLGFTLKIDGEVLWSQGCKSSLYLDERSKEDLTNGCDKTSPPTTKQPELFLPVRVAEEGPGIPTNTTSSPESPKRSFMSTVALVFAVLIGILILALILRFTWKCIAGKLRKDEELATYQSLGVE